MIRKTAIAADDASEGVVSSGGSERIDNQKWSCVAPTDVGDELAANGKSMGGGVTSIQKEAKPNRYHQSSSAVLYTPA